MPQLVRLYIANVALGFAVAAAFVFALVMLDVGGIGHLVRGSDMGVVAALMLWVFNGVIFAGVQFAISVMGLAEEDHGPRGGLRAPFTRQPALIPVRVEAVARSRKIRR